ncbi:uncharacterized protein UDID_03077 [Ustilago sp. UG-2017a]|nr:uncharacterized protein UDID_03077 [Ustilago sp. UG-2017a]
MTNNTSRRDSTADTASASESNPDTKPSNSKAEADNSDTPDNKDTNTGGKEEVKIYKTISRVHRACNACRKQKARCDGPENPPCRRCRQVGIECIFEKPPKDSTTSASTIGGDTGASSDRIKVLEAQMAGMQSIISELVASIKANTNAIAPPQQPPQQMQMVQRSSSGSRASPHSSKAGRGEQQYARQMQIQQGQYVQPPHHSARHSAAAAMAGQGEGLQRYPLPEVASSTAYPQRPPYPHSSRSMSSNSSMVSSAPGKGSMTAIPFQAMPGYPLQQPPSFQSPYGQTTTKVGDNFLQQQQPELDPGIWNATGINASASSQSLDCNRHRSGSHDRGRPSQSQPWQQQQNLLASSTSPSDRNAASAAAGGQGAAGWTPTSSGAAPRRQWTSSDRATSHSHTNDQNLTPSDGQPAGDDADTRETDISNDQLSAPIEALRGLADAAAAAAAEESEGHTSNDSSDEKNGNSDNGGKPKGEGADATPSLQLVDEGGKRTAFDAQDEGETGGHSPRKKGRRDASGGSPHAAASTDARSEGKLGAACNNASSTASANAATTSGSGLSPSASSTSRSGKMEAPGLITSAPGDLITLGLVNETDAMRLFETFQKGVPKFISIFHLEDESMTTEEAYHYVRTTSYFLFNVMLAIGAKVECGGKSPSRLYQTCMAQAKRNAKDTMFSPVDGKAAVQAMVLLAAYSDNGWLPLGLSIRMAQELGLDRSFQKLMSALPASGYIKHPQPPPPPKHLTFYHNSPQGSHHTGSPTDVSSIGGESADGKMGPGSANAVAASAANRGADAAAKRELEQLKDLARGSRLWFFLFLFDHQASYGAGRPAMLSKHYVRNCRAFLSLNYPLTVKTDARFISTLELLIIRETHYDAMAPYDQPVDARMLSKMRKVTEELNDWHQYWSSDFESRGYGQDSFFQQSLVLQCASAELYLSCTALRGIRDANDADRMGPEQKELIIQATCAADTCLGISVNAKEYREMLGWAPHYTHVTAAFACVFLIKIARLFPRQVDTYGIFSNAERLASRLAEVPASKYARVIRTLLAKAWKKIADLSPAIGLYAALGTEGTRPGAITPAEIKSGGPSDSGISLLYKLLQEHQNGQMEVDQAGEGGQQQSGNSDAGAGGGGGEDGLGGSGSRTPGFGDSNKWLIAGISSPSVGAAAMFSGLGGAGSGSFSPNKGAMAGLFSHRGSISGGDFGHSGGNNGSSGHAGIGGGGNNANGIPWSSFLAPNTPSGTQAGGAFGGADDGSHNHNTSLNHPIQLPLWMQESTGASAADLGAFGDAGVNDNNTGAADIKASPVPGRSWSHQDHYRSPVPHHASSASQYRSPAYQASQACLTSHRQQHGMGSLSSSQIPPHHQHRHSNSLGIPPSPSSRTAQMQQGGGDGMPSFSTSTNFDSVLSDLGLPLDGLDGLFVDLPINAPTGQSNYSV